MRREYRSYSFHRLSGLSGDDEEAFNAAAASAATSGLPPKSRDGKQATGSIGLSAHHGQVFSLTEVFRGLSIVDFGERKT